MAGVLLDKMPAAMRKDVDAAIGELPPGKKQPSRWTRREAAERAAREGETQPMDVDGGEGGEAAGLPAAAEEEQVRAGVARLCGCGLIGKLAGCSCTCLPHIGRAHALVLACWLVAGLCIGRYMPQWHATEAHPPAAGTASCPVQEGDAYEFATPVDILGPLGKAQLTCDDDPPVPFWEAADHKKWGLRKVRCAGGQVAVGLVWRSCGRDC